jgi:isopenicillin N synthase-like dioxygenase
MLMRWTNDTYVSTLRRVMNLTAKARLSISFFVWPNPHAQIACLETCTTGFSLRHTQPAKRASQPARQSG